MIFLKRIAKHIKFNIFWMICYLLPIKKNKVCISSFYGRGYGDHAKYIAEYLLSQKKPLRIIWFINSVNEKASLPKEIVAIRIGTFSYFYHLMTSRVWIDNCRKWFKYKKPNQFYLQVWHGFALKRIEQDVSDKLDTRYVANAIHDSKNIDVIVSCSSFMTSLYKKSFWYDGLILEYGSPRNDAIINQDFNIHSKVKNFYNIDEKTKIVLYAPTFRANLTLDAYDIDLGKVNQICSKKFGGRFVSLLRLHPNIAEKAIGIEYCDSIINATMYPDLQELLSTSDIVISDYSSLMFDFALSYKPVFQYAIDISNYMSDRNFYFDLRTLPFTLTTSNYELFNAIDQFDIDIYRDKLTIFFEEVGMVIDGNASERCGELILSKVL